MSLSLKDRSGFLLTEVTFFTKNSFQFHLFFDTEVSFSQPRNGRQQDCRLELKSHFKEDRVRPRVGSKAKLNSDLSFC